MKVGRRRRRKRSRRGKRERARNSRGEPEALRTTRPGARDIRTLSCRCGYVGDSLLRSWGLGLLHRVIFDICRTGICLLCRMRSEGFVGNLTVGRKHVCMQITEVGFQIVIDVD